MVGLKTFCGSALYQSGKPMTAGIGRGQNVLELRRAAKRQRHLRGLIHVPGISRTQNHAVFSRRKVSRFYRGS
jgi:hypothetical protein